MSGNDTSGSFRDCDWCQGFGHPAGSDKTCPVCDGTGRYQGTDS